MKKKSLHYLELLGVLATILGAVSFFASPIYRMALEESSRFPLYRIGFRPIF